MAKIKVENLLVVDDQKDEGIHSFPVPVSPHSIGIERTPENERKYRHLTCLIVPVLRAQGNRILIVDKNAKERAKNPAESRDIPLFDVIGGHFSADEVPEAELTTGALSAESALEQAFRELTEELQIRGGDIPPFVPGDLVFFGFCPYESATNRELSLIFGLPLEHPSYRYRACDDAVIDGEKRDIPLRLESFSAEELARMWRERETTAAWRIADGLGRLLERGDLPGILRKTAAHGPEREEDDERKSRFLRLVNIGALDLTYTEKRAFYQMAFSEKSYREIAGELGIGSPITVNSMRQRFDARVEKARAVLELNEMLPPIRKYRKARRKEWMPVLDEKSGKLTGRFCGKDELHDRGDPLPHATVITLVCKRGPEGLWRFLVADKANRLAVASNSLDRTRLLDFAGGGHVEIADLEPDPKVPDGGILPRYRGTALTDEVFRRTALREFREEVKIRSAKIDPAFMEWCDLPFDGPALLPFGGWNREIVSKVFLQVLPRSLDEQKIRVHESYEDSLGRTVKSEHVAQFLAWDELDALYGEDSGHFLDGAARVIRVLREKPALKTRMCDLLDRQEKKHS
jgi:hypothetical protein